MANSISSEEEGRNLCGSEVLQMLLSEAFIQGSKCQSRGEMILKGVCLPNTLTEKQS